jgi:hypothetical protein
MSYAEQLAHAVKYDYAEGEGSVDSLIAYKNALEDALEALEDALGQSGPRIDELLTERSVKSKPQSNGLDT